MRLQEVGRDRAPDERGATREAELPGSSEEVVVAPAGEPADLLLGVVADPEPDLAGRRLGQVDAHGDLGIGTLVLLDAHGAEQVQRDEVPARAIEEALLEGLARRVGELAARHRRIDGLGAGDARLAEDARRAALEAIGDPRLVAREIDRRLLRDLHTGETVLAVVRAEIRGGPAVRLLGEDAAARDGEVLEQEPALAGRQLGAGERHVEGGHGDGLALVDEDDGHQGVARRGQLQVVRDADVVMAAAAVQLPEAIEVGAEGRGVEQRSGAPDGEPSPRLGRHHLAEVALPQQRRTPKAERAQPPGAGQIERLELHGGGAERCERREEGDERGEAAHGASHVTGCRVGRKCNRPRPRAPRGGGALTVSL